MVKSSASDLRSMCAAHLQDSQQHDPQTRATPNRPLRPTVILQFLSKLQQAFWRLLRKSVTCNSAEAWLTYDTHKVSLGSWLRQNCQQFLPQNKWNEPPSFKTGNIRNRSFVRSHAVTHFLQGCRSHMDCLRRKPHILSQLAQPWRQFD